MNATLLPFHQQLSNAWKLFLNRWGVASCIQLLMIIPSILMLPLVMEYVDIVNAGATPADVSFALQDSAYGMQFVVGIILLVLLGVLTSTAKGILFAAKKKISFFATLAAAGMQYIPVLYTTIVVALALLVSLIPPFLLNYWYYSFARSGVLLGESGIIAVDAIVLIAIIALLIPAVVVAVWVMYAPLAVALKAAPAGFTAIMFSKDRVHGHLWQVLWRVIGSMVLFSVVSWSVVTLPVASFLVPFILIIIITAFFVELYKELDQV